jgi:hypothetical protein
MRRALGAELLSVLEPQEAVAFAVPASTWASPQALLAVTDRRLLWLLDDAVSHRVRSLRFADVASAEHWLRRPLRRVAVVRVVTREGRHLEFAELRPATAAAIVRHVRERRAAATPGRRRRERLGGVRAVVGEALWPSWALRKSSGRIRSSLSACAKRSMRSSSRATPRTSIAARICTVWASSARSSRSSAASSCTCTPVHLQFTQRSATV